MGKKTDKVFHLTVAALALTLGAVSLGTVAYQNHPEWMQKWLKQYNTNTTQMTATGTSHPGTKPNVKSSAANNTVANSSGPKATGGTTNNTSAGSQAGAKTGTQASDVAYKPSYTMTNNNMLVQVKGVGKDVTTSDVSHVKKTLANYKIVELVSQALQMNVYQSLYILVAKTPADYQQALSTLGVSASDAKQFTMDTGGFAQGDTIIIPLYQNKNTADLANTLSHELTHAFLNMNVSSVFPSWINEGLAVTDGMSAQAKAESLVVYDGYARQMGESILDAEKHGSLQPLEADEAKVLAGTAPYDLELQDWLAARDLINTDGYNAFSDYFYRLNLGESQSTAFARSFGMPESTFNTDFTKQLKTVLKTSNDGVTLTFATPSSYHGAIRFLQHGTTSWTGFHSSPGQISVSIATDGAVTTNKQTTTPIQDSNPADDTTLYVNLDPYAPLSYDGQKVKNSGFAIDYHYGMYGFVNAWITLTNGKSLYFHNPTLFGVTITDVKETAANKWFTGLLVPPTLAGKSQSVPASASGSTSNAVQSGSSSG